MNKLSVLPIAAMFALVISSCKETKIQNVKMENSADSLSYAIGINIGESFKEQKITEVNTDLMAAVIRAILTDDTIGLKMNDSSSLAFLNSYMRKKAEIESAKAKKEGEDWLAANAKKEGVMVTPSGLQYKIISSGTGATPVDGDQVTVHYTGKFIDGEIFDSSVRNGQPVTLGVNGFMQGFSEALKMMKVGDKWNIYIPSELGYGPAGYQGFIPPNAVLEFELELLGVIPAGTVPATK